MLINPSLSQVKTLVIFEFKRYILYYELILGLFVFCCSKYTEISFDFNCSSWEGNKDYNPWWMRFSKELELEYNKEPDLWFKVSLILLFGVFVGIQIVHGVVSVR